MNGPGFTAATQLRSGALGLLKKDFVTSGPQGLMVTNEPWAAPFIRTTVELEMPLFLMSSPLRALVEGSNVPTMISVRMSLFNGWRTAAGAVGTGQARQRSRWNGNCGPKRKSESGNPGKSCFDLASSSDAVV